MDFNIIEKRFKEYVNNFDWGNEKIRLKYYHTLEVANISYELAEKLNLSEEDKCLAKLIGYLHDIGRFEQVTTTGSFKDKNLDHADNGVKLLFEKGLIREFIGTDIYDDIILKAIKNHNKLKIMDEVTEREKLFANIIRDSDKIDIFRVRKLYDNDEFILEPSKNVIDCFKKETSVLIGDIKNKSDSVVCVMAFVFDFNYKESLQMLKEKGYYESWLDNIKVADERKELFNKVKMKALKKFEV